MAPDPAPDRTEHWERVHASREPDETSWYQAMPRLSLELIEATGVGPAGGILDVGGGASTLVDHLQDRGYRRLGVLDVSPSGLERARRRLGERAAAVEWFVSDATEFSSPHRWDIWHDRAVYHFLTDPADRARYLEVLRASLEPDGHVVLATFGPEGPTRCSGLDVVRYSDRSLAESLGDGFELMESRLEDHATPSGGVQQFQFSRFRRHAD